MWPSLLWIMNSPRISEAESQDSSPKAGNYILAHKAIYMQEHGPLLGQLEIEPFRINRYLNNMGVSEQHTNPENMKRINSIIFNASLQAYMRYESWKRGDKYRIESGSD